MGACNGNRAQKALVALDFCSRAASPPVRTVRGTEVPSLPATRCAPRLAPSSRSPAVLASSCFPERSSPFQSARTPKFGSATSALAPARAIAGPSHWRGPVYDIARGMSIASRRPRSAVGWGGVWLRCGAVWWVGMQGVGPEGEPRTPKHRGSRELRSLVITKDAAGVFRTTAERAQRVERGAQGGPRAGRDGVAVSLESGRQRRPLTARDRRSLGPCERALHAREQKSSGPRAPSPPTTVRKERISSQSTCKRSASTPCSTDREHDRHRADETVP
jgi:hypothetical protein